VEQDHYWRLLQSNFIGMHGAVLYRKGTLLSSGGFNESLRACEDYELYLRLARNQPICCHDAVVAEYRQHDYNMSKDHAFMFRSVMNVLRIERGNVHDRRNRRALRAGFHVWRRYYGELLLNEWKELRGRKRLLQAARLWPEGALREAARDLLRRWRGARRFGTLNRLLPVSRQFGFDRGLPIDRYYIEKFLAQNADAIRGRVLEIGDDTYSRRFGGSKVVRQDVLHVAAGTRGATITADLADAPQIPAETFDCIILTQTLQYILDLPAALATLRRILKPGGVLLATLPGISQICRDQEDWELDCWRFTSGSATRLFGRCFGPSHLRVCTYGNVLAAISFLEGLAVCDVAEQDLDYHDPDYQVTIAVAATKGN
jgi:SAM-dependent methyltransferase